VYRKQCEATVPVGKMLYSSSGIARDSRNYVFPSHKLEHMHVEFSALHVGRQQPHELVRNICERNKTTKPPSAVLESSGVPESPRSVLVAPRTSDPARSHAAMSALHTPFITVPTRSTTRSHLKWSCFCQRQDIPSQLVMGSLFAGCIFHLGAFASRLSRQLYS